MESISSGENEGEPLNARSCQQIPTTYVPSPSQDQHRMRTVWRDGYCHRRQVKEIPVRNRMPFLDEIETPWPTAWFERPASDFR
jgi:hypothetical protein